MIDFSAVTSITIPEGEVQSLYIDGVLKWEKQSNVITVLPINDAGQIPVAKIDVVAGDVVTIIYYLTVNQGYIYDGRKCGLQYYGTVLSSAYPIPDDNINKECSLTLTIPKDGFLVIGGHSTYVADGRQPVGEIANTDWRDVPIGKYIKVIIN